MVAIEAILALAASAVGSIGGFLVDVGKTMMSVNWYDLFTFMGVVLVLLLAFDGWTHPEYNFFDMVRDHYDQLDLKADTGESYCTIVNVFGGGFAPTSAAVGSIAPLPAEPNNDTASTLTVPIINAQFPNYFTQAAGAFDGLKQSVFGAGGVVATFFKGVLSFVTCGFLLLKFVVFYGGLIIILLRLVKDIAIPMIFN